MSAQHIPVTSHGRAHPLGGFKTIWVGNRELSAEELARRVNAHDEFLTLLSAYLAHQRGEYSEIGHEELAERAAAVIAKTAASAS